MILVFEDAIYVYVLCLNLNAVFVFVCAGVDKLQVTNENSPQLPTAPYFNSTPNDSTRMFSIATLASVLLIVLIVLRIARLEPSE